MKAYPSSDGFISVWYDNLVDCGNSDVYNSLLIIKIKGKYNDNQPQRKTLLPSNLNGLLREIS